MEEGWSKCNQVHMKIWNSKSGTRTYFDFEIKFGAFFKVNFGQTIYHFEAREVKNPTLQIMNKLKLKRGSYVHLKQTRQRRILSLKLKTWIQNDFWPFKTQRNARILATEAKLESSYLFWINNTHFEPKNMVNPKMIFQKHGQWVSSEFTMNIYGCHHFFYWSTFQKSI